MAKQSSVLSIIPSDVILSLGMEEPREPESGVRPFGALQGNNGRSMTNTMESMNHAARCVT
jgi:hypothetical protein